MGQNSPPARSLRDIPLGQAETKCGLGVGIIVRGEVFSRSLGYDGQETDGGITMEDFE